MAVLLLSASAGVAQMVPASDAASPSSPVIPVSQPLYNAAPSLEPNGAGAGTGEVPGSSSSQPAPGAFVQPPAPRRTRDLKKVRGGDRYQMHPFRAVAFGVTASTLGGGVEMAMPLARTLNVRVGVNYVRYNYPFAVDGINYDPGIKFRAGRGTIDWFPHHGGFHVSAGALYFLNTIGGAVSVPEGQTFTLGGTTYLNSVDDPIHGTGSIAYGKTLAPMLLLGFGNILPRSGRHFSVPIEFGGAYLRPPTLNIHLAGTACTTQGCFNAATDAAIQANLAAETSRFTSDLRLLQVYPIVSLGLACRF